LPGAGFNAVQQPMGTGAQPADHRHQVPQLMIRETEYPG